jgi:hypothetical protein
LISWLYYQRLKRLHTVTVAIERGFLSSATAPYPLGSSRLFPNMAARCDNHRVGQFIRISLLPGGETLP